MSDKIDFTSNYTDHSTNQGFQFEFHCDRCHSGFRTKFQASLTGAVSGILGTLGGMFGGVLGRAGDLSEQMRSASWQQARDKAFQEAVKEAAPEFIQCPHCLAWVCRAKCWNEKDRKSVV